MNMKKKILSAAVLATLGAGSAQAVYLGTDGTGQVLLFPYYTVQGNEETLLTVVNTKNEGKAVKIRFREAENSREVLDFNIYLSPYDVWVGKITDNDAGDGAAVVSPDTTCTVPVQISQGQKIDFRKLAYAGGASGGTTPNPDSGTQDLSRTREGYVEILEMGVIDGTAVWDSDADGNLDYVHINGTPDNCSGLQANMATILATPNKGLNAPSGGLFGELAIINVQSGTEVGENATALEQVFSTQQHFDTGTLQPTLQDADAQSDVLDVSAATGNPTLYTDNWAGLNGGIDAVSAVLMSAAIANTYTVNPAVEASTAWVVTFPTKWFYTQDTTGGTPNPDDSIPPFTHEFANGQACEEIEVTAWDREEKGQQSSGVDFSPQPGIPGIHLCYEVNVIQFEQSNVLSAANTVLTYTGLPGVTGWAKLSFPTTGGIHQMTGPTTGVVFNGLPVIGFSTSVLGNSNVGVGASYGNSNSHTYLRGRDAP